MPQSAGGKKKKKGRAPAHQNKFAFRHNPKSKKTDKILASPNVGVCRRCHEKIEWRKQYRKYKPLTQPGKCNLCQRRNIKAAYHTICGDCAVGDRANKAVLEATTGVSGTASGKTDAKPEAGGESKNHVDQQVSDEADAIESTSDHGSDDEEETSEMPRNRRVCAICVKDYALGSLEDDEEGDELALLEAALEGKLKLREKRAIERKIERLTEERRRNRRKAKEQEQEEEDGDEESGEDDESDTGENEEQEALTQEDTKVNDDDSGDEVEEEDDPFLKAVGGSDKLLTGEAYQKALLEKAGGA